MAALGGGPARWLFHKAVVGRASEGGDLFPGSQDMHKVHRYTTLCVETRRSKDKFRQSTACYKHTRGNRLASEIRIWEKGQQIPSKSGVGVGNGIFASGPRENPVFASPLFLREK